MFAEGSATRSPCAMAGGRKLQHLLAVGLQRTPPTPTYFERKIAKKTENVTGRGVSRLLQTGCPPLPSYFGGPDHA